MRMFTRPSWLVPVFLLAGSLFLHAQKSDLVVVQKATREDGSVTVTKKRIAEGDDLKDYLKSLGEADAQNVEIHLLTEDGENVRIGDEEGETLLFFRDARREGAENQDQQSKIERIRVIVHDLDSDAATPNGEEKPQNNWNWNLLPAIHNPDDPAIRSDRPLLGIYPGHAGQGVEVDEIVLGGGAEAAGIRAGDLITAINGAPVTGNRDLSVELSKYKAGDQVRVDFLREGRPGQATVTLKERTHQSFSYSRERDPCKVFIGVSLSGRGPDGRGITVSNTIEDTPAKASGIQAGDVILALDDVEVNSFNELLRERNKHQAGDWFTLSVLREGRRMDIDARFKSCEKDMEEEPAPEIAEEEEIAEQPENPVEQTPLEFDNTLEMAEWSAFPNPTFGRLNVRFQAQAAPTLIQVLDTNGKAIYRENLNQFDGYYNEQIDLGGATPGAYYLQVRQGEKIMTEKIVVMPRA